MLSDTTQIEQLRCHDLFRPLPEGTFADVCNQAIARRLGKGEVLFHQGEPAERFYLVLSGQVKLMRVMPEGREKLIDVVQPGQCLAEALMFSAQECYPVSAAALENSQILSIQSQHYRQCLSQHTELCFSLLATLSQRLHRLIAALDTLSLTNASDRVRHYLLQQADDKGMIQLDMSKRLLASLLGIQPETLSRALHRLQESGMIEVHQRQIRLMNRDALLMDAQSGRVD